MKASLAVVLVALCVSAIADVTVSSNAKTLLVALDKPAGFGPKIAGRGILGRLVLAHPDIYACQPLDLSTYATPSDEDSALPLIVLAQRSPTSKKSATPERTCAFDTKISTIESAGGVLGIIYDTVEEPLLRMMSTSSQAVNIPSVFVSEETGLALRELLRATPSGQIVQAFVDRRDPFPILFDTLNLTMLGLVIGFLLIVLVCGALFLCTNSRTQARLRVTGLKVNEVLPMAEVLALSEVTVGENDKPESKAEGESSGGVLAYDNSSCPVCLEDYQPHETLKLLPCRHAFHTDCIAPWLTERQRTCPLCKVTVGPALSVPLLRSAEGARASLFRVFDHREVRASRERRHRRYHRRFRSRATPSNSAITSTEDAVSSSHPRRPPFPASRAGSGSHRGDVESGMRTPETVWSDP